ncbi:MAG: tripartite tricarboxylate transporter substrate binding protein [Xanthobacteraceae bacterium]|nr:tripartite tricarboxylate transporter substrate binding protein [Xanthobacteraceae bacterium]
MKRLTLMLLSGFALAIGGTAVAQDKYPSKPVKIVVPYAPGGGTDITARIFGDQLKNGLGQQFVVENKPGAFGILAVEEMARSRPDGYTLMIGNVSTNAITPVLFKNKFKIDFEKDVVSVARLNIYPSFLIVTNTNFDVKDVKDLMTQAKTNPGKIRYTSAGIGSFPHFDMEIFARRAGIEMNHIPNKTGAAGMLNDLVVGDAQVAFLNSASSAAMIKAGKLKPLAVVAEQRVPGYPDVPTMAEAGFKGVGTLHWQSMLAPAATPRPVIDTLFKAVVEASKQPALKEAFDKQLVSLKISESPDEAKTWLKGELDAWRKITSEVKIELAE